MQHEQVDEATRQEMLAEEEIARQAAEAFDRHNQEVAGAGVCENPDCYHNMPPCDVF